MLYVHSPKTEFILMSLLLPNRKGNPHWKGKSGNPEGRPKLGTTLGVKRTLARLKRNPVKELIDLADICKESGNYNTAIKIWEKLYDDSADSGLDAEKEKKNTEKFLEELEKDEPRSSNASSDTAKLGTGETEEAS